MKKPGVIESLLRVMEDFYPEFLEETNMSDTPVGRAMFYHTMHAMHRDYPLSDVGLQAELMMEIDKLRIGAIRALSEYMKNKSVE